MEDLLYPIKRVYAKPKRGRMEVRQWNYQRGRERYSRSSPRITDIVEHKSGQRKSLTFEQKPSIKIGLKKRSGWIYVFFLFLKILLNK